MKIGYADNVAKRVKTLNSNSGLPDPYHVYATYRVKKRLEDLKLHKIIDSLDSDLRHAKNKEFYEMTPEKAYNILSAIAEINGDEDLLVLNPMDDDFFKPKQGEIEQHPKTPRREKLTFALLGIPIGSELVYKNDTSVVAKTVDNESGVEYQGKQYTISGLVSLMKGGGSWQGGDYMLYNGKKLTTIRMELENWKRTRSKLHG